MSIPEFMNQFHGSFALVIDPRHFRERWINRLRDKCITPFAISRSKPITMPLYLEKEVNVKTIIIDVT